MRKYSLFITVSIVLFLTTFTSTAVSVALPNIRIAFDASILLTGWVVSGYLLTLTISVALGGRLSDAFGQKPVFTSCLLLFTVGTGLCWVAPNAELLVVFRLIQGLGAGALASVGVAIVAGEFPASRQKAIGLLMSVYPLGTLAGPNVGGWIVTEWGWRSVFWISIPLLAVALLIVLLMLRQGNRKESHLDLPGAFMLAAFLSAVMVSLSLIKQHGTPWGLVIALLIVGVIIIVLFIRRESHVSNPIMDPEFLRSRAFAASNAFNLLYGACTYAVSAFVPMYAVAVYNETTLKSGIIMTPRSLGMLLASTIIAMYVFRLGYRWPMILGSIAMGLSSALLAIQPQHIAIFGYNLGGTDFLLLFMALSGLGLGAITSVINNVCVDLAPQRAATVTGLRSMFLNAGASVGTVSVSLVLSQSTDLSDGFYLVFTGLAAVSFISIPLVFLMPGRPIMVPSSEDKG